MSETNLLHALRDTKVNFGINQPSSKAFDIEITFGFSINIYDLDKVIAVLKKHEARYILHAVDGELIMSIF